jgi:hypothetical protein
MGANFVHAALNRHDARWFAGLGAALAHARWAAIETSTKLTPTTYGTARYLARDVAAARHDLTVISLPTAFGANRPVIVETLLGGALSRYCNMGLSFYAQGEIDTGIIRHRLEGAFRRLSDVSGVAAAVGAVLAALHVLKPAGPNYDVSYSDPVLPFSIFVGIDASTHAHYDLRLAESILHECMHLQLSLIEETVPMIAGSEERFHSPWQQTMRPSQGVLHGLYVFRVIQDFHRALIEGGFCTDEEHSYLTCRISVIEGEIATIDDFRGSRELTNAGKQLVSALLMS